MPLAMDRRGVLKAGLGLAALTAGPFGISGPAAAQAAKLRSFWWGSQDRARRTNTVAELYTAKNPDVQITGEVAGNDYWPKLATQMAGRNIPDVFQLEPNTVADYSRRGACMPLDPFIGKELDLSRFSQKMVDLCKVDGKIYGVALGLNSFSLLYDEDAFKAVGLPVPTHKTTWDEYARLSVEFTKAHKKDGYFAAPYGARYYHALEVWLRQRGKMLFTPEGKLGFNVDDAKEYLAYWEDLRQKGGCVPADVQAQDALIIDNNPMALGKAATAFAFSNQLVGYQLLTRNKLGLTVFPQTPGGTSIGQYYRPALIWSVGSTSKLGAAAARYISFFVNDLEAGKVLGVERGVPMSSEIRKAILPTVNDTERASVEFVSFLEDKVIDYPPPAPKGAQEYERTVVRVVADQLAFGKISVADGAKKLIEDGNRIL